MTIYLSWHHYGKIAAFKLLWSAKFKSENSLVFGYDIHRNVSSNRHYNFQYATKWHWTRIINLLNVFSFAIFNEPDSIIANYKSTKDWIWIIASSSISTFTPYIITQLNLLWGLETILITMGSFRLRIFLLIFCFNYHHNHYNAKLLHKNKYFL